MYNKPLHILLADDDSDDCLFFKSALDELSLSSELSIVNDGEQLMQVLADRVSNLPEVLFLDINMPRKNGLDCLSEIRLNKRIKELPVVMFSTSTSRDKISMLFKTGAHVYIHKPGDFAQLKQVIYHALPMATESKNSISQIKYILNA